MSASPIPRRSQRERRDETQRKLLEATLECLAELGYARTTTPEIVRRAGLSQGALFKHYASKDALLAAAMELLFGALVAGYERALVALPKGRATPEAAFELLWSIFTGPRLAIAFELYMVARTDRELARCLEPVVRHHRQQLVQHARALFPAAARNNPEFDAWVDLLMCSMEGLVIESYGAGPVTGPARAVLKRLILEALTRGMPRGRDLRR
ncbi:MAG TPA: TetR/AcrR family transcriptional regulator [Polyangiaceae bacterium]|nr:TetR/AcrR family transcriptional regulator [Polyangiaceae bacterium]